MSDSGLQITHQPQPGGGRYLARIDGEEAAGYLEWEASGARVRIAAHTVVPARLRGRGIAAALVEQLITDARADGFRIVPQCSYVAASFARHPEWAELRAG
ncbi:MAG TPA: GNAT family N-acetyltransferase [Erythrobacter sp.]|nr:GNAT family N-acetyltransferase [Erythrobacter sp.]